VKHTRTPCDVPSISYEAHLNANSSLVVALETVSLFVASSMQTGPATLTTESLPLASFSRSQVPLSHGCLRSSRQSPYRLPRPNTSSQHTQQRKLWLRRLLFELRIDISSPTVLRIDNQSAIAIARNPEFHDRTKHIAIRHYYLRQLFIESEIDLTYVPTNEQFADALTKGLVREKHERHSRAMGLRYAS
jgi:hypothetical protein